MPESKIELTLSADENSKTVTVRQMEEWIEEVKRHTDSDPDQLLELYVGTVRATRTSMRSKMRDEIAERYPGA
jgi:hypothetical protein